MKHYKTEGQRPIFGGYVPTNIIGYADKITHNALIWRTETQKVKLFFDEETGIKTDKYFVPGLVWSFTDTLNIYAYKEWQGEATKLYRAPFLNVNDGHVCLGTATDYLDQNKNEYTFRDITAKVEAAFFKSSFTHTGNLKQIEGSFLGMYEQSKTAFPLDVLVESDKTIKTLCDEIFST